MIKRITLAAAIVVSTVIGFANVAAADNCPSNAPCGASMPTVPVVSSPNATSTTTTVQTTTQVTPTTTTQQSSTGTPTISVPTIPVTPVTIVVPTIDVPTVKSPSASGENASTAQTVPVIPVPKMTWGDESVTPTPEAVDPSPVYPKVVTPEKSGSTTKSSKNPSGKNSGNVVWSEPDYVIPVTPVDNGGLPYGSLLLVGVGALAAVSYRAAKERGNAILGARTANRQQASS